MASRGGALMWARHAKVCASKIRHETEGAALRSAAGLVARGEVAPGGANAYRCRACRGWHVGKSPAGRRPDPS